MIKPPNRPPSELVQNVKQRLGINKLNIELSDEEIILICHCISRYAPDYYFIIDQYGTRHDIVGRIANELMMSVALYEFPDFYERMYLINNN